MFQHALDPCPPDPCLPAGDGPADTAAPPAPYERIGSTRTPGTSLVPALRLAADLADRLATAGMSLDVSVGVAYHHVERCPAADFLVHGEDARRLVVLAACSRLFDVPLTVTEDPPAPETGRVWVGGAVVRGGVRLVVHAFLTDPAAVADACQDFPAGTGGW